MAKTEHRNAMLPELPERGFHGGLVPKDHRALGEIVLEIEARVLRQLGLPLITIRFDLIAEFHRSLLTALSDGTVEALVVFAPGGGSYRIPSRYWATAGEEGCATWDATFVAMVSLNRCIGDDFGRYDGQTPVVPNEMAEPFIETAVNALLVEPGLLEKLTGKASARARLTAADIHAALPAAFDTFKRGGSKFPGMRPLARTLAGPAADELAVGSVRSTLYRSKPIVDSLWVTWELPPT